MTTAILTEGLARRFDETEAVAGVDLEIGEGEIYGFLGPNGAGKSTMVRMLCTLLQPTGGRAIVAGRDVCADPGIVRLRIGVALQDAGLDPKQTGRELLRLQGRLYGLRGKDFDQRVLDLVDLVDIGDAIDRRIGTYSGGMRRRLDLAASLMHEPQVVFLDEPTTGLDPESRARVWNEVRRLNRDDGTTIFLTTQYLEEADALADRVGIIDRGRIVAEGAPSELKRSVGEDVVVVRVATDPGPAVADLEALPAIDSTDVQGDTLTLQTPDGAGAVSPIAVTLARHQITVKDITLRTPTLDDVFLAHTGGHLREDA